MSSLLQSVLGQLGGDRLEQLSGAIGADRDGTQKAVSSALPMLLGALSKNSESSEGAAALEGALARDHDGSVLDNLSGFLGSGDTGAGEGILGHLLGGKRQGLESAISKSSGLGADSMAKLLPMLAPIVMGALGKKQREGSLDASGLASMLSGERREIERQAPETGGILTRFLDQDGDGDVDLGDLAKGVLSKFF